MIYLLDTNVCISYLRGTNSVNIAAHLDATTPGDVVLCSVVKAELLYGAERSQQPQQNYARLQRFFSGFPSLAFDDHGAAAYAGLEFLICREFDPTPTPLKLFDGQDPVPVRVEAHEVLVRLRLILWDPSSQKLFPGLFIARVDKGTGSSP